MGETKLNTVQVQLSKSGQSGQAQLWFPGEIMLTPLTNTLLNPIVCLVLVELFQQPGVQLPHAASVTPAKQTWYAVEVWNENCQGIRGSREQKWGEGLSTAMFC